MRHDYVIISANMPEKRARAAHAVNRLGGVGPALWEFGVMLLLGIGVLIASLTVHDTAGWVLMWGGMSVPLLSYWFIGRYLIVELPPARTLTLTNDREIIGLDREWWKYIDALPKDQRWQESQQRFSEVRRLNDEKAGSTRSEVILGYRRKLQAGESPVET